jgi:hypothetical protein
MLVSGGTVLLKNRDGLGGPSGPGLRCRRHALCSAQPDLSYSFEGGLEVVAKMPDAQCDSRQLR